jgi:hypothetical protein
LEPVRQQGILTDDEINTIFSNVETILTFHRAFNAQLQERRATPEREFADIFVSMVQNSPPFLSSSDFFFFCFLIRKKKLSLSGTDAQDV